MYHCPLFSGTKLQITLLSVWVSGLKGQRTMAGGCFHWHTNEDWFCSVVTLVLRVFFFFFLFNACLQWSAKFFDGYGLCCSVCYCSAPASLHSFDLGSYGSWHCVWPHSLLGLLLPTLSNVISSYLHCSRCLCILLSSILHTLAQVLYFKGIKKWLYC